MIWRETRTVWKKGDFSEVLVIVVLVLRLRGLILVSVTRVGVRHVFARTFALKIKLVTLYRPTEN
jgi:hypothetical protein